MDTTYEVSMLILVLLRVGPRVGLNNKRQLKFRKACSCNWTRRRAYWLQKRLCRADYIAFALRSKTLAAKSFKIKATHTISTLGQPSSSKIAATLDSVVVSKETRVRRRLLKRRDSKTSETSHLRKVGVPFLVTPKRRKRRIGFHRRSGNLTGKQIVLLPSTELKRNHARNTPRRKKK